jgi:predicted RNA-binding Zn ribbon-like protein
MSEAELDGGDAAVSIRFRVTPAPGDLRLVQALLNTAAVSSGRVRAPDLLDAPDSAAAWFEALGVAGDRPGLRELQGVRDSLRRALVARDHGTPASPGPDHVILSVPVCAQLMEDGSVRMRTTSDGASGLVERVLLAVHDAQVAGSFRRLKVCRNPECRVSFWDKSPNTGGVWHDVHTCGNAANLRNSRARRAKLATVADA